MKRICIIVILLFLFTYNVSAKISDGSEYLEKNVVTKKLKNGITLIMLNRGYAPTLSLIISFKVGSVDESYNTIGAAHFLEHMLFKGTDRIGTKDFKKESAILKRIEALGETLDRVKLINPKNIRIPVLEKELKSLQKAHSKLVISSPYSKIYSANGGVGFNASTSRDRTTYYINLPASKLKLWAGLESERLRNPVLREFYLERKNVIEERLMRYESRGSGALFEKFMATAFTAHPYRHPTIGWRSNIPFLSIKDIRDFYWKYYIPSRMSITVVGKQNTDETFRIISKYFGKIESKPNPPAIPVKEPVQIGEKRISINFRSSPYLMIGWHKPTFPSIEDYAFDIISDILTSGKTSRLYKSLVLEKKIASSVSSWNGGPGGRFNNLFVIFATPKLPGTPLELEKEIYKEINRLVNDISDREVRKVIKKMESSIIFKLDTNSGIAHLLSYYQTVFDDWKYAVRYINVIKRIKIIDLKKAIKKYIKKQNRVVGILYDSRKKKKNKDKTK